MKKFLLLTGVVAAMASCSDNEMVDTNDYSPNQIQFSPYAGAITKAVQTTLDTIKNDANGYGVHSVNSSDSTLLDNINIVHNGSNFESVIPQYWDATTDYIHYAYYPYSSSGVTDLTVAMDQISSSASTQSDILVGDVVTTAQTDVTDYETVTHTLGHALASVDFAIDVEDGKQIELEIKSFKIQGVMMNHSGLHLEDGFTASGTTTLSADSIYTYGTASDFSNSISIADSCAYEGVTFSAIADVHDGTDVSGSFMVLPQTLTAWGTDDDYTTGARIVIEYNMTIGGKYIVGNADTFVAAAFPITSTEWVAGNQYKYALTFTRTGNGGQNPGGDDGKTPGGGNGGNDTPSGGEEPGDPIIPTALEMQFDITVTAWTSSDVAVSDKVSEE